MTSENVIVFSTDIQQLKGIGTEYLLNEHGELIAKFIDGDMECIPGQISGETLNNDGFIQTDVVLFVCVGAILIYLYGC
jgi:hypothetical protein